MYGYIWDRLTSCLENLTDSQTWLGGFTPLTAMVAISAFTVNAS